MYAFQKGNVRGFRSAALQQKNYETWGLRFANL